MFFCFLGHNGLKRKEKRKNIIEERREKR